MPCRSPRSGPVGAGQVWAPDAAHAAGKGPRTGCKALHGAHCRRRERRWCRMKASATQIVAASAALIASAVPAARPRAGESTIRLDSLLPGGPRARAGDYAFLFFERAGDGGQAYYAEPGAPVHADARLLTGSCQSDVLALPRVCGGSDINVPSGGVLADKVAEAGVRVGRAAPSRAARLVDSAARALAESEYDANEGGGIDEVPSMLNGARNDLVQAAAEYRHLADNAEAAAASVHRAWASSNSALARGSECSVPTNGQPGDHDGV